MLFEVDTVMDFNGCRLGGGYMHSCTLRFEDVREDVLGRVRDLARLGSRPQRP